jgi:hypothetical protein
VADVPDTLVLKRHRDLEGVGWTVWLRRAIVALLAVLIVLALLNLFGQRPHAARADATQASLQVYAPSRLRGGLLYMARFTISAHEDVKKAMLVLDSGWAESTQINTIEPSPIDEGSDNGRLSFELGHIAAGNKYRLFMEFQVNPTNVGSRDQDVELLDGKTHILTIHRSVFVWP